MTYTHTTKDNNKSVNDTPLYQMVYYSSVSYHALFQLNIVKDLSENTFYYNSHNGITGILCFGNCSFLHYIEGSEEALTNFKNIILKNILCSDVHICDFSQIPKRRFTNYTSGFIVIDKFPYKINENLNGFLPFKPMSWSDDKQLQLFDCIKKLELVDAELVFSRFDSSVLRLRLTMKLGSAVLTRQQMYTSISLSFCFLVATLMVYVILFC